MHNTGHNFLGVKFRKTKCAESAVAPGGWLYKTTTNPLAKRHPLPPRRANRFSTIRKNHFRLVFLQL